jgi:hypothetical protein
MVMHSNQSVKQRVDQMILGAKQQFGCSIVINQSNRSAEQAQQFHICHMFLHNFFKHLKPKYLAADGRTIDWIHLSDATVDWALIPRPESLFLYTKHHKPSQRQTVNGRSAWIAGHEPDKHATVRRMKQFLEHAHVSSMAAPGKDGCGEPCLCGGHASKHITGLACDVSGMDMLGHQILSREKGFRTPDEAVDHFLARYGLWRPLDRLQGKAREAWHLEALPHHHARPAHPHVNHPQHAHPHTDPHLHTKLNNERTGHKLGC